MPKDLDFIQLVRRIYNELARYLRDADGLKDKELTDWISNEKPLFAQIAGTMYLAGVWAYFEKELGEKP